MENNEIFTVEYIASLPVRKINFGGQKLSVRYDSKKKRIFLLDRDGNYSGRWGHADLDTPQPDPEEELVQPQPAMTPLSSDEEELSDQPLPEMPPLTTGKDKTDNDIEGAPIPDAARQEETGEAATGEAQRFSFKNLMPQLKVVATVAAIGLTALILSIMAAPRNNKNEVKNPTTETTSSTVATVDTEPTEATVVTTEQTEPSTETTEPAAPVVLVLTAARDLLPGHRITKDDLSYIELSDLDYQTIRANGGVYASEEAGQLIGLEVAHFIAGGTYIGHDDLVLSYAPVNPWGRTEAQQYVITVPITVTAETMANYLPGTQADITIVTETKVTESVTPSDPTEPSGTNPQSGAEHNSSTVESMIIDTYVLRSASIIDILDPQGNSLFPTYYALASVPVPYLQTIVEDTYPGIDDIQAVIPGIIKVAVTADQAALFQEINQNAMTVTIDNTSACATTDLQSTIYPKLQSVAAVLAAQWSELDNGGA